MPEMALKGSAYAKARSEIGVAARRNDPEAMETARRDFAAEKLAAIIEKILATAPPLTEEQRVRLAELLRPVRRHGGAHATT